MSSYRSIVIFVALLLASCAMQPAVEAADPPGLLWGLLHGAMILFSLIGSVWWDIRVYAFPNGGIWYDLGFVIGVAIFFGAAEAEDEQYFAAQGYDEGFAAGKRQAMKKSNGDTTAC